MGHNTVYVVDDDAAVRTSLAFFLATAGYSPRPFADPKRFLAGPGALQPGCVLLDLHMPGIDGFEVLERLDAQRGKLPVVVMTGHGDVATAVRAMKLGACDFLEKPFEEELLLEVLHRVFAALDGEIGANDRRREAQERIESLTDRERAVLHGLLDGRSNRMLAGDLEISVRTVEMHRAAMMDRLRARTFADALRLAFEGGIAVPGPSVKMAAGAGR